MFSPGDVVCPFTLPQPDSLQVTPASPPPLSLAFLSAANAVCPPRPVPVKIPFPGGPPFTLDFYMSFPPFNPSPFFPPPFPHESLLPSVARHGPPYIIAFYVRFSFLLFLSLSPSLRRFSGDCLFQHLLPPPSHPPVSTIPPFGVPGPTAVPHRPPSLLVIPKRPLPGSCPPFPKSILFEM